MPAELDRFFRFDELTEWLHVQAAAYPNLLTVQSYGRSSEGRELWLATLTDAATGSPDAKAAHWVDANIHSIELASGVAALALIRHLVDGFGVDDTITRALRTRTFYVAPRVNPDGVEWALADSPRFRRSSVRPWPWTRGDVLPGLHEGDIDGDGRMLSMRVPDPFGAWTVSAEDARLLVPVPLDGLTEGAPRYRLLMEGTVVDHDGWTVPTPPPPQSLDLNRNFPAGWSLAAAGRGDHPLAEPEVDALVRAIVARPNICGYNALHTSGGVLLRPSSTAADSTLPPRDLWVWKQLAERGEQLTGYKAHSVFEDFTWDTAQLMSGAADDWAYEHLGIYSWTTELWDVIHKATGTRASTKSWYVGPSPEEELAVLRWLDEHHEGLYVDWYPFEHPQLGPVELGGWDWLHSWSNPPAGCLLEEVVPHASFAVFQALAAPSIELLGAQVERLGLDLWRVTVGVGNSGWLPTDVTDRARREHLVLPLVVELAGAEVIGGPARLELGQLAGASEARFRGQNDGTPDRVTAQWVVRGAAGSTVTVQARHVRAGRRELAIDLG